MGIIDRIFSRTIGRRVQEGVAQSTQELANTIEKNIAKYGTTTRMGAFHGGAAGFGFIGSGDGSKWPGGLSASGSSPILNHYALRQNARSAFHDSTQARAMVTRWADTVVDTGLMVDCAPDAELLGLTDDEADAWATDVEKRFNQWASAKKQARDGTMNFYQAQRLYEIGQQRDNDLFVRLYYSRRSELLNPLQFGFIDPNQIRGDAFTSTYTAFHTDDGIVRHADGREKAYKIWIQDEKGEFKDKTIPAVGRSGRTMMLHGFAPEYAGQGRGYTRLAHAIQEFENLTDFTSSEIKKAIAQASIVGYTMPSADNPASNPFEDIANGTAGPTTVAGTVIDGDGDEASLVDRSLCPVPEAGYRTPGSMWIGNLAEGEKLEYLENKSPATGFGEFVDTFMEYLASSNGMSPEALKMKFGSNYSASRGALILFWRVAMIWRAEMAADFLDPTFEMWISEEIAAGRVSAPGWMDPRLRAAWVNCTWIGAPMPNIDPMKTMTSDKGYIEIGATTQDRVARDLNGSDIKSNLARNAKNFAATPAIPWGKGANSAGTGAARGRPQGS